VLINADDKFAHLKGGNLVVLVVFVNPKPSGDMFNLLNIWRRISVLERILEISHDTTEELFRSPVLSSFCASVHHSSDFLYLCGCPSSSSPWSSHPDLWSLTDAIFSQLQQAGQPPDVLFRARNASFTCSDVIPSSSSSLATLL
jgi:hypothetical protein